MPFVKRDLSAPLFDPRDAETERNLARRAKRRSPLTPSQAKRRPKAKPKRTPLEYYTKESYRTAIRRWCDRAGVPPWHPHQLRHNAATRLRKEFGLEVAQFITRAPIRLRDPDLRRARQGHSACRGGGARMRCRNPTLVAGWGEVFLAPAQGR